MPDKMYRVEVSIRAAEMMVNHAAFLSEASAAAAERLTVNFEETAQSLSQFPNRGAWFGNEAFPYHKYRYLLFSKWYLMIYRVIEDTVFVDYVIDGRQDYHWLFY